MQRVRCSISPAARMMLSKLKSRQRKVETEFLSSTIEAGYPYVDEHVLNEIYRVNPRFQVEWELQGSLEHRWHIKLHLTDSRTGPVESVYLVQWPEYVSMFQSGEYRPLDHRVVTRLKKIMIWSRNPVRFARDVFKEQEDKKEKARLADEQEMEAWAKYYRRAFLRLRHNSSDPGWESGFSKNPTTGQYEVSGHGAHGQLSRRAI